MPARKNRTKSVKKVAAKIAETPTHSYGATDETRISASEFKARCLELMDTVQERHEPIVITKHGVPVARLVAFEDERPQGMVGSMRGSVLWYGDLISPIDVKWDAGS
ncbi:MAG: type II toxin-antitoxin system Phd/YefM family antitoxin [Gemmatimonadota bacterium]|nr:type II toxin-antitoxin system Phd/YefM family antitoxin [Gemmatimonadota bacterium]